MAAISSIYNFIFIFLFSGLTENSFEAKRISHYKLSELVELM